MTPSRLVLAAVCLSSVVGCNYDPNVGYAGRPPYERRPLPEPYPTEDPYDTRPDDAPAPPPPPSQPTAPGQYPTAERTAKPDEVISPYEPYNVIDVAGFRSGQLARDPSNQKIFRIP